MCWLRPRIRLIKIDVEGGELAVLQGGSDTLRKAEYLVMECSEDRDQVLELLHDAGFATRTLRFTSHIFAERTVPRRASPVASLRC